MGYRSETAICLSPKAMDRFVLRFNTAERHVAEAVLELVNSVDKYHYDKQTRSRIWFWNLVKWYPDYDEIKFMETLMDELDEDDFLFIRIGENTDDTEIHGVYHDNPFGMYLTRRLEFGPAEEKAHA